MSERNKSNPSHHHDPARALEALSAKKKHHDFSVHEEVVAEDASDALGRLESGQADAAGHLASPEQLADQTQPEDSETAGLENGEAERPARTAVSVIRSPRTNAQAHAYRKFMVPVLLTVGALLVVVGFASGYLILTEAMPASNIALIVVMAISFPLALTLFLGAWWFIHEIRLHEGAHAGR